MLAMFLLCQDGAGPKEARGATFMRDDGQVRVSERWNVKGLHFFSQRSLLLQL